MAIILSPSLNGNISSLRPADFSSREMSIVTRLFVEEFLRQARSSQVDQLSLLLDQYSRTLQARSIASQIQSLSTSRQRTEALDDLRTTRVGLRSIVAAPELRNNATLASHVLKIESTLSEIDEAIELIEKIEAENVLASRKNVKDSSSSFHLGKPLAERQTSSQRLSDITQANKDAQKKFEHALNKQKEEIHESCKREHDKARLDQAVAQGVSVSQIINVF